MKTLDQLAYVHGEPEASALFKQSPEDFIVEELASFEFAGEGEHLWLLLEREGQNTQDVVKTLQRYFSLPEIAIGFAGRKDKHARTIQWFSLHLKRRIPVRAAEFERLGYRIHQIHWHQQKLRRGQHDGNRFSVTLRDINGNLDQLESRVSRVGQFGAPNYFGPQRFGYAASNLSQGLAWLNGESRPAKLEQGFYLSALRSALFNDLLSMRIEQHGLDVLPGDLILIEPGKYGFAEDPVDQSLQSLLLLVGESAFEPKGWLAEQLPGWEQNHAGLIKKLLKKGLQQEARPMRILPQDFRWKWAGEVLELQFELPVGSFATSLLREVVQLDTSRV